MPVFGQIVIACLLISSGALVGVFSLALAKESVKKILLLLVGLSAGTLMGGAFLHLLPEALEGMQINNVFGILILAFIIFFCIEKFFHWRHCHKEECEVHSFGPMNLIGDSVHNFIDGLIIAATFLVDVKLGVATAVAIAFHEIPQEIGDFGVLIYAGYQRGKALTMNFLVALMVVAGGIIGFFLSSFVDNLTIYLLPFAAGGFLYISTSDLIPEIRGEKNIKKSILSFIFFLIGILIMYLATMIE